MKQGWCPPVSPYGLIQETLWPAEWQILVVCILLNQTQRKQVEAIAREFFRRWPTAQDFINVDPEQVVTLLTTLGFCNRRTDNLIKMTKHYLTAPWEHANELPGIGDYGSECHEIFCRGNVPLEAPSDHALKQYVLWYNKSKPEDEAFESLVSRFGTKNIRRWELFPGTKWPIDIHVLQPDVWVQIDGTYWHGLDVSQAVLKTYAISNSKRQRAIYGNYVRDRKQDAYAIEHNLKLLRVTDKAIKNDALSVVTIVAQSFACVADGDADNVSQKLVD